MTVQLGNKDQKYSYAMNYGPLSFRCNSDYAKDLKRLDRILKCLGEPNTTPATLAGSVGRQIQGTRVLLVRILNFLRTGTWMNEAGARKLVKYYAKLDDSDKQAAQTAKVQQVYDKLSEIKHGRGTYADGIDRSSLEPQPKTIVEKTKLCSQDLFKQLLEDPRLHEAMKVVGNLAVEAIVLILTVYATAAVNKTTTAALSCIQKPKPVIGSRVFTV